MGACRTDRGCRDPAPRPATNRSVRGRHAGQPPLTSDARHLTVATTVQPAHRVRRGTGHPSASPAHRPGPSRTAVVGPGPYRIPGQLVLLCRLTSHRTCGRTRPAPTPTDTRPTRRPLDRRLRRRSRRPVSAPNPVRKQALSGDYFHHPHRKEPPDPQPGRRPTGCHRPEDHHPGRPSHHRSPSRLTSLQSAPSAPHTARCPGAAPTLPPVHTLLDLRVR